MLTNTIAEKCSTPLTTAPRRLDVECYQDHALVGIKTANGDSILCGCVYWTMAVIIIAGDFNYKNIDWCNEYAEQEYLVDFINTLQECFLCQHVTESTRHRENETCNLLDLVLYSDEGMVKYLSCHPPLGESDHVVNLGQVKQETPPSRNIYKANCDPFKSDLNERKWEELLISSFDDDCNTFSTFSVTCWINIRALRQNKCERKISI